MQPRNLSILRRQFREKTVRLPILLANIQAWLQHAKKFSPGYVEMQAIFNDLTDNTTARANYLFESAEFALQVVNTDEFSDHATIMEMDDDLSVRIQRLYGAIEDVEHCVAIDQSKARKAPRLIALLCEDTSDLLVDQADSVDEMDKKMRALNAAGLEYTRAIEYWESKGGASVNLLLAYLNTQQKLLTLATESKGAYKKEKYLIEIHKILSGKKIESLIDYVQNEKEYNKLKSEISSYHFWYADIMRNVTPSEAGFIRFLRYVANPPTSRFTFLWQDYVDELFPALPPKKRIRMEEFRLFSSETSESTSALSSESVPDYKF